MTLDGDLVFHQLKVGPMANFVYLIGSKRTRECLLVDPAWDIDALLQFVEKEQLKLVGALATHAHPDHVGGDIFGLSIEGLPTLLARAAVPVHVNRNEADSVRKATGISESDVRSHDSGDVLELGDVRVRLIHTPGHTPGSQCFMLEGPEAPYLVSGDTLFIQGCGRVDLPGGDPQQMYESLTQKLAKVPPQTILYPGHDYSDRPSSPMSDVLRTNEYLNIPSLDRWMSLMGGGATRGYT
ncbi:MAG: MBL fold metallo-hydrolase [Armatimonadetes bacterium]|nr:MBL fold metallo-hydrolase [Armatimonadota bacterium]